MTGKQISLPHKKEQLRELVEWSVVAVLEGEWSRVAMCQDFEGRFPSEGLD